MERDILRMAMKATDDAMAGGEAAPKPTEPELVDWKDECDCERVDAERDVMQLASGQEYRAEGAFRVFNESTPEAFRPRPFHPKPGMMPNSYENTYVNVRPDQVHSASDVIDGRRVFSDLGEMLTAEVEQQNIRYIEGRPVFVASGDGGPDEHLREYLERGLAEYSQSMLAIEDGIAKLIKDRRSYQLALSAMEAGLEALMSEDERLAKADKGGKKRRRELAFIDNVLGLRIGRGVGLFWDDAGFFVEAKRDPGTIEDEKTAHFMEKVAETWGAAARSFFLSQAPRVDPHPIFQQEPNEAATPAKSEGSE